MTDTQKMKTGSMTTEVKKKKMGTEADELIVLTTSCLDSQPDPL